MHQLISIAGVVVEALLALFELSCCLSRWGCHFNNRSLYFPVGGPLSWSKVGWGELSSRLIFCCYVIAYKQHCFTLQSMERFRAQDLFGRNRIFRFAYKEDLAYKPMHTKYTEFRNTARDLTYNQKKSQCVWSTELNKLWQPGTIQFLPTQLYYVAKYNISFTKQF